MELLGDRGERVLQFSEVLVLLLADHLELVLLLLLLLLELVPQVVVVVLAHDVLVLFERKGLGLGQQLGQLVSAGR